MKYLLVFVLVFSLDGCGYKNTDSNNQLIAIHNNSKRNVYIYYGECDGKLNYYNPFYSLEYYIRAKTMEKIGNYSFESIIESEPCKKNDL